MILTCMELRRRLLRGELTIDPFDEECLSANSYDVRLGSTLLHYPAETLDTRVRNEVEKIEIPTEGLVLPAGSFHVGCIAERIGSDKLVPLLHAKMSSAMAGLFVHVTANLIDIGNFANFSLHLHAARNVRVYAGIVIAEISFWEVFGDIRLYNGKYKNVIGPAESQSYKHFPSSSKLLVPEQG